MNATAHISDWLRAPYVILGEFLDRWYEEMPWRREMALGPRGEAIARRYLRRRGYLILTRNFRSVNAEIDIVALDGDTLVFVEVKAREGIEAGTPREAVDDHKQEQIRRAAANYVAMRHAQAVATRFDVVAITGSGRLRTVELIKDAF